MTGSTPDFLFVIDPLEGLNPKKDTSLVMMKEALARGFGVWACDTGDLFLRASEVYAHARQVTISPGSTDNAEKTELQYESPTPQSRELGSFGAVFMRKDPPFDENYLTATWCLDRARGRTMLVNDPHGLRELNEKLAILEFPELTPETRLLRHSDDLRQALEDFGGHMIIKPVLGFGGRGVLQVREGDPNISTLFEIATEEGQKWTIAQAFVPEASAGDKRILMVDGEAIGAVLRVPAAGELRGNFHAGGSAQLTGLDDQDREICARVGPFLQARGQFFAGLDVIGGRLTELNVTSPTGMQEVNRLQQLEGGNTMQARFWDAVERKLEGSSGQKQ